MCAQPLMRIAYCLAKFSDVNPDKPTDYGLTPPWCASFNGPERVVKLLLAPNDVNPGNPDSHGQTILLTALFTDGRRSQDSSNLCPFRPPRGDISPHSASIHLCLSLSQLFPFAYQRISAAFVLCPNSFTAAYYIRCHHLDSLRPFLFPFYFPKLQSF